MIRNANTASEAWQILRTLHLRRIIHNRGQKKDLYDFKLLRGEDIMDHIQKFHELCLSMEALGDVISQDEKLGIDILQVKEMLRREYEGMVKKEVSEVALQTAKYKSKEPYQGWKGR
uniref:AlNc14C1G8 protein n=1 Tax=Albugo laibachii Nc14 TaxID=890382 RepID=F0VYK1_9STRA|nr:AlNc14C1G8 [Albugo laibachii Nc14]|eukprot:CCA13865.1 AlNc14C1G8 [Albugo laibachii Nc14]